MKRRGQGSGVRGQGPEKSDAARSGTTDNGDELKIAGVRIIGGAFRGRALAYSGDVRTRPMKDRTREAIFNLIGVDVIGRHAFDLFAGTGALGLEALSRGSAKATFVERHLPTRNLIEQNIRGLGLEDRATAVFSDAFMFVRKLQPDDANTPWVVFCSPPYELFVSRLDDMLAMIRGVVDKMPVGSTLVVEADERFDVALLPADFVWRQRTYAPAVVCIAEKTEVTE